MSEVFVDFLWLVAILLVLIYGGLPLIFLINPGYMQNVFFLNFVKAPYVDYTNLALNGINAIGRNFYLDNEMHISAKSPAVLETLGAVSQSETQLAITFPKLGVWHILPRSLSDGFRKRKENPTDKDIESALNEGDENIVIYLHGNSFDRATNCRGELYNVLSDMNYHVLAIDYRGYGDSTGIPSEKGLSDDAKTIYRYAREVAPRKNLIIWGHSMGSGVAALAVGDMFDNKDGPEALVLESPFNNLSDVMKEHPFSFPVKFLPKSCYEILFVRPLQNSGLVMNSDERLTRVQCPMLILHSQDDHIIPVELARKLVKFVKEADRNVTYVEFDSKREFQHKYIYRAKELPEIFAKFMETCKISGAKQNS